MNRLLAAVLALLLIPSLAWAPTQVAPTGGAVAPTTAVSAASGFGKQWFTGNQGAPVAGIFVDDQTVMGFHPSTATQMDIYGSQNGGRTYTLSRSIGSFAANSFGQLLQVFQSTSGRVFFVMLSSNGGLSFATNISGTAATGWNVGPAGGGTQDGITGAQGPNGTIVYIRESGGVGQACRSINDGTTFTCNTFIGAGSTGVTLSMVSPVAGTWMFANNGSLWRSTDDGQSFVRFFTPANGIQGIACLTPSICLIAAGGVTAATVFRSTDAGATWSLQSTFTTTWSTQVWGAAGIVNFGGGIVTILGTNTLTAASPGYRSTDFGQTWTPLPVYNTVPGGTNGRSITGVAVRGGRAIAFQWTQENINTQLYSPVLNSGSTTLSDNNGNTADLQRSAVSGQVQVPSFQGEGMTDSTRAPWAFTPVQRTTLLNTDTTGAANTAVVATLTAVANQRSHVYKVKGRCNGAGTSNITIADGATTIYTTQAAGVPVAPGEYLDRWNPGLTGTTNTAMTITLAACGVGITGTLNVHADKF